MDIRATSKFLKSYSALSQVIKNQAVKAEKIFRINPFDQRLLTHKLRGKYKNFWAFKINRECRIMFIFVGKNTADFINIGTHEIYK
jgi:mRNA-degrading endonuclease YafQ of YafQ-DinJ toxin-antitoxin module